MGTKARTMSTVEDLTNLPPTGPAGETPGVHLEGDSGFVTTPVDKQNHEDVAAILRASRLDPDDFFVDWSKSARITTQLDANGDLVQMWTKLPLYRRPERTVDVQDLVERIHEPAEQPAEPARDDLTIMLTDQHIGKSAEAGGGTERIAQRWKESVMLALIGKRYKNINLVFGGDTIEGYVSQNGRNINQTDLVLAEQLRVAQQLVLWTIQQARNHTIKLHVSVVPGNHAETTRVQGVPMGDNFDVMIVKNVQTALELAGAENIEFHYPDMTDGSVTYEVEGTTFTVVHGHQFKNQMKGAENWWSGHIANGRHPQAAHILLAGHFHNFQMENWTRDRWIMFGPSLEDESTWFANKTGATAKPGALVFETLDGDPFNVRIV